MTQTRENRLARVGLRLSAWFERWFPDAFALALLVVVIVFLASLTIGASPTQAADWFGAGFWDLVPFTMQMAMILVTGYVAATSPPIHRAIQAMASWPRTQKSAIAWVAVFSMLSSLVSWSFSLVCSGLLAREVAQRVSTADYRALGAAAYLGVGSVWALGLSSSAALIMATPTSLPPSLLAISGAIPLNHTLLLWQSALMAVVLIVLSTVIAVYSAPRPEHAVTMSRMGVIPAPVRGSSPSVEHPGEWLEHSPLLTIAVGSLGYSTWREVHANGAPVLLQLNRYIFLFLMVGLLLHWRPRSFVRAVSDAVPSVGGVLVQYPLYAGAVGIMTESGLASRLAHGFVAVSNEHTFLVLVGIYSAALGVFIPSAGARWLVEAPYVLANLIHPFWMLPLPGILGIKARDILGYCALQFAVHVPVVLLLVWALNYTLQ